MEEKCKKCGTTKIDGYCACKDWEENESVAHELNAFEHAILVYNELCRQWGDEEPISGNHWTGGAIVLFKGTAEECEKVKEFIRRLQDGRVT